VSGTRLAAEPSPGSLRPQAPTLVVMVLLLLALNIRDCITGSSRAADDPPGAWRLRGSSGPASPASAPCRRYCTITCACRDGVLLWIWHS
jgi:hypothetical protein